MAIQSGSPPTRIVPAQPRPAVLLTLLAGCVSPGAYDDLGFPAAEVADGGIQGTSQELVLAGPLTWPYPEVSVCFENYTAATDAERVAVREGAEKWTVAPTSRLKFVGWKQCSQGGADIHIHFDTNAERPNSALGMDLRLGGGKMTLMPGWSGCPDTMETREPAKCMRIQATHEFGHALGFGHEHDRDHDTPLSCKTKTAAYDAGPVSVELTAYDSESVMNYCASTLANGGELTTLDKAGLERVYGRLYGVPEEGHYSANFDGKGGDDLLCHNPTLGEVRIDYAQDGGAFASRYDYFRRHAPFCHGPGQQLFAGDFDGDGADDLLCHDPNSAVKWIDLNDDPVGPVPNGVDVTSSNGWCPAPAKLYVGDFNGDTRDDMLCHRSDSGKVWVDLAERGGHFSGTDYMRGAPFCYGPGQRLHIADVSGDGKDDLLCHDRNNGAVWTSFSDPVNKFLGSQLDRTGWCTGPGQQLYLGRFNADARADLLCHDPNSGTQWITYADAQGRLKGGSSMRTGWCHHPSVLHIGDYDGDGRDDLMCHEAANDKRYFDFAKDGFVGTNYVDVFKWCSSIAGELH